jgi:MarR family 2-MHQ and catechol resistance regulon transcriptional repressor
MMHNSPSKGFAMTVAIAYIDANTCDDAKQRGDSDRDVIMGAAANYDQNVLVPCVESLLRCGFQGDKVTYEKYSDEAVQAWLVLFKALRALTRYAPAGMAGTGLGDSDFRVLEVLLHKGPLPVNTIGLIVEWAPGSISVAVDRLHQKGLVSRTDSSDDRRVRVVALTKKGRDVIVSVFQKHAAMIKEVFSELSSQELRELEASLKRVGKRAERLWEAQASRVEA